MANQWSRNGGRLLCYALTTHHSVFKFPAALGPFRSAAEAGEAMDMLLVRYPDLCIRLDRMANDSEVMGLSDEALNARLCHSRWWLERLLMEPFSVVETIEHSRDEVTIERVEQLAASAGCQVSEVVVFRFTGSTDFDDPLWVVFRRHLQTEDVAKAETKALWLRREREQKGLDIACVMATTLPLYCPATKENAP